MRITEAARITSLSPHAIEKMISLGVYRPSRTTSRGRWREYEQLDLVLLTAIVRLRAHGISAIDAAHLAEELRHELRQVQHTPLPDAGLFFFVARHGGASEACETIGLIAAADASQLLGYAEIHTVIMIDIAKIIGDVATLVGKQV